MTFSRPRNESPDSLDAERRAAKAIEAHWRVQVQNLSPHLYGVDWAIYSNGTLWALAEFKRRTRRYETFLISAGKFAKAKAMCRDLRARFLIIVEWDDGLWCCSVGNHEYEVRLGGSDRGQDGDKEPVVHIPVERFRLMIPREEKAA